MSLLLKFLPASRRQEGSDDGASVVPEEHVDVKQEKSTDIVSEVHQVEGLDSSGSSSEERAYCFSGSWKGLLILTLGTVSATAGGMGRHLGVFSCTLLM